MAKTLRILALTLLACFCLQAQDANTAANVPAGAKSPARLNTVRQLLEAQAQKQGSQATAESLQKAITNDFLASDPTLKDCSKPFITEAETLKTAKKNLQTEAYKQFPEYTPEQLKHESEVRFPLYKRGQKISIRIRTNPKRTEQIEGRFNGTYGGNVAIGQTNYRLADMQGIPGNDGPEGEIAKLDERTNREYRQEWREEYTRTSIKNRTSFLEDKESEFNRLQQQQDFLENESRGYTYFQEKWLTPDELLHECSARLAAQLRQLNAAVEREAVQRLAEEATSQQEMTAYGELAAPYGKLPSAEKVLEQQAAAEKRRAELKARREAEAALMEERARENARQEELRRQREAERRARLAQQEVEAPESKGISLTTYAVGGVIVVLALLGAGWWWTSAHKEDELDVSKFFEGKGKLQKEFWDAANADPEHFKYVAYLFPDMESAQDALLRLSYIKRDEYGNTFSTKEDLRFGCYEHQNGAVCFVGSPTLNYARWREASMIWPELPLSNYFKVSSEPIVSVMAPDLDKLREQGLHVESLGAEDVRMDSGEINRVFRYKVANKEEAIKLLNNFDIKEEGIVVKVETADGEFGKDIRGVFAA